MRKIGRKKIYICHYYLYIYTYTKAAFSKHTQTSFAGEKCAKIGSKVDTGGSRGVYVRCVRPKSCCKKSKKVQVSMRYKIKGDCAVLRFLNPLVIVNQAHPHTPILLNFYFILYLLRICIHTECTATHIHTCTYIHTQSHSAFVDVEMLQVCAAGIWGACANTITVIEQLVHLTVINIKMLTLKE